MFYYINYELHNANHILRNIGETVIDDLTGASLVSTISSLLCLQTIFFLISSLSASQFKIFLAILSWTVRNNDVIQLRRWYLQIRDEQRLKATTLFIPGR